MSVYLGMESIVTSGFSRGFELNFIGDGTMDREALKQKTRNLAARYGVVPREELDYACVWLRLYQADNLFRTEGDPYDYSGWTELSLMTLEEYNRLENASETLQPGEVLIFPTALILPMKQLF